MPRDDSQWHIVLPRPSVCLFVHRALKKSLCNQLFSEFSSNQFETLHIYQKHIEDMHVEFCRRKNNFDKITAFSTQTILRLGFNMG